MPHLAGRWFHAADVYNNCVTCGASSYSYKKYLGKEKPAFRSPAKIVDDIKRLNSQGIYMLGIYQDPRMGGEQYCKDLFNVLRSEKLRLDCISIDIFAPVTEDFVKTVAATGKQVVFYYCPESGNRNVRRMQGRGYSNEDILNTIRLSYKYKIPVTLFLSTGLAGETFDTMADTMELWEQICELNKTALENGSLKEIGKSILLGGPIMGPIIVDPGSLAADCPEKYGYKMSFNTLEDYIQAFSLPSWHQWINYETALLSKDDLIKLIFKFVEFAILQREKSGLYEQVDAEIERFKSRVDKIAMDEVDAIMQISEKPERTAKLKALKNAIDSSLNSLIPGYMS
jgi:hypothetical protein